MVALLFWALRVMVGLGLAMIGLFAWALSFRILRDL
jgi:cytochrome bd-type quinol oxidase subunit 1